MPRYIWGFFMTAAADKTYMAQALQLAQKGFGKTNPNPMVGAVLVKNKRVIGEGYHRAVGKDHAEIMAIKNSSESVKGATLYVNLEPCCHRGRTGPCTEVLIREKIGKVVISTKDPNPLVNGKGIQKLRRAGIEVVNNVLKDEAFYLNDQYMIQHKNKKPFVILKLAQTLDGKIATKNGESKYLSSSQSLKFVHLLRSSVDAVAIGAGTADKDNPRLNVRLVKGDDPYRIILSKRLQLNPELDLLKQKDHKTIIASSERSIQRFLDQNGIQNNLIFWSLKNNGNGLSLEDLLQKADQFGIKSILCEGGAAFASALMKQNLVDKLILVTTPKILGNGIDSFNALHTDSLTDAVTFKKQYNIQSGTDMIFVGYPKK